MIFFGNIFIVFFFWCGAVNVDLVYQWCLPVLAVWRFLFFATLLIVYCLLLQSIVREAMAFIQFTYTLFNQEFLRTKGFTHLQWYVNRVALSVLLPIRPSGQKPSSVNSGLTLVDFSNSGTFPRQSKKKKGGAMEVDEPQKRKRGHTVHGHTTSDGSLHSSSPLLSVRQSLSLSVSLLSN